MKTLYTAAGILIRDRKLLVTRAKERAFFISPGGRIEPGETAIEALIRELREEFTITVEAQNLEPFGTFIANAVNHPDCQVNMQAFMVKSWQGEPVASSEIEEIAWISSDNPAGIRLGSIFEHEVIPYLKENNLID